ncbi:isopentenyl-diphosphate Delta-isomerase [Nocardioidaceae bacterium]|nr:isopentenyl-diphosphate Delta-isomerase [Nocardioidaceae bacterium]
MTGLATPTAEGSLLAEGYRRAARITRQHGTTYYWGARLLPPDQRKHVFSVYGLARLADDIVDEPQALGVRGSAGVAARLDALEADFVRAVETGGDEGSVDPVVLAAAATTRERGIDLECFTRFFAAMRQDLTTTSYATWEDLLGYMDGSAAVIGEMMLPVLDPPDRAGAVDAARALGLAFQLTNFLRDVGEDLDRGRVYVPAEDLDHFGVDPHAVRDQAVRGAGVGQEWRALMRFEIARNRRLYREADAGLAALPLGARRCVTTARLLYARILDRIEDRDHDVFTGRARVARRHKLATAARVLRSPDPATFAQRAQNHAERAESHGATWPDDDDVVLLDAAGHTIGTGAKSAVHHDATPLHLAFSCYVVDAAGRVLVTTRAHDKASFPGVLTNSVCGHPRPGEDLVSAVRRRVHHELGLEVEHVRLVLPEFAYVARTDHLVERETCPVVVATVAPGATLAPHPAEVADVAWWEWSQLLDAATDPDSGLSTWARLQVPQLAALGADPRTWPEASYALLPPALRDLEAGRA